MNWKNSIIIRCGIYLLRLSSMRWMLIVSIATFNLAHGSDTNLAKLNYEERIEIIQKVPIITPHPDDRYTVDSSTYFPKSVQKKDIFISGKTVSIDSPLHSFGGNVLIIADKLSLNAPIDTRPRLQFDSVFWVNFHFYNPGADRSDPGDISYFIDAVGPRKQTPVTQAFADLIYWHDYYEDACKCFKYKSISIADHFVLRHSRAKPTDIGKLNDVELPLLPFGLTPYRQPYYDTTPSQSIGFDAPAVKDTNIFQSGSITIFANEIHVCDDCIRTSSDELKPKNGDLFDKEWKRFLITAGLKGSRGGAGAPAGCYEIVAGFCRDRYNNAKGGNSGKPGKGADAGDINIFFFSKSSQYENEIKAQNLMENCRSNDCNALLDVHGNSIAALSLYSGGSPSHTSIFSTPSINDLKSNSETVFRSSFTLVPNTEMDADTLTGRAGKLNINRISLQIALQQIVALLDSADMEKKYDQKALMDCLFINQITKENKKSEYCDELSIAVKSPLTRNQLTNFLIQILNNRQDLLIEGLKSKFIYNKPVSKLPEGDVLEGLTCDIDDLAFLSELERQVILRLCQFRLFSYHDLVDSYFFRVGGMFNPSQVNSVQSVQLERAIVGINKLGEILLRMERELKIDRKMRYDRFSKEYLNSLLDSVRSIQVKLVELNEKMSNEGGIEELAILVSAAGQDVSKALKSYAAEDYVGGTVALFKAFKSIGKIFDFVDSKEADKIREKIDKFEADLYEAEIRLIEGYQQVDRYKRLLTLESNHVVSEYVKLLQLVDSSRINLLFEFDNLIKNAMILHAKSPMRSTHHFHATLNSTESLIEDFPYNSTSFIPMLSQPNCLDSEYRSFDEFSDDEIVRCLILTRQKNTYGIFPKFADKRFSGIPLTIVEPGEGIAQTDLFGILKKKDLAIRTVFAIGN